MATVRKGTTFNAVHADGNPTWKVTKKLGRGVWEAVVTSDCPDFAGTTRAFKTSEIQQALGWKAFFAKNHNEHDEFYAGLMVGSTVHYSNGFKQFIRCEVVAGVGDSRTGKALKPVAMVGEWRAYDLPRRLPDGTVDKPYHVQKIEKGEPWTPNYSNLWEANPRLQAEAPNVPDMPALDLSVPEPNAKEQQVADLWQKVQKVSELCSKGGDDPEAILAQVRAVVSG